MRDFQRPGRSAVFSQNGMCATSHPLAAKAAVDMLQSGGNAVDAAITAAVLLGICEPQMTGLGGDMFALVKPAGTEEVLGLNASGRAPAALDADALRVGGATSINGESAAAVTVPGAVDGFFQLSEMLGTRDMAACLAPAIHYAEAGVPVAPRTAFDWKIASSRLKGAARRDYLFSGNVPTAGQVFRSPKQADALRLLAKDGRAAFYEGPIADDLVAALQTAGGCHTNADFAATASVRTTPISATYRGTEIVEHPPNGQGATALLIANILSHFDLASLDPSGAERAHLEIEATKLGYDARNRFISDPDRMNRLDEFLSMETAQSLAALIDPKRVIEQPATLTESVHKETVYLTVVDRDRMAVSLIYSIFSSFGSGIGSERFGILLQNRGSGFNLIPGHPNEAGGSKRPLHTIIPGMLRRNGRLLMPFGVMGGAYQACGHARFVSNLVDFGMDPQEAVDAPRCFPDAEGLRMERGYSDKTRRALAEIGHPVVTSSTPIGGAQAILIDPEFGVLQGASDPRKDGCAIGY